MYFATEWLIDTKGVHDFPKMIAEVEDLGGQFWHKSFISADGYCIAVFTVNVTSVEIFKLFAENIRELPFKNWKEVNIEPKETEFVTEFLAHYIRYRDLSGNIQSTIEDGLFQAGYYNELKKSGKPFQPYS